MQLHAFQLPAIENKIRRNLASILTRPPPRYEDRLEIADAGLRLLPALVKLAAGAVAGALADDFGPRQVRHRLHDAGKVIARVGPVRDFAAVEQLQCFRPPDRLRPRRPNRIAAIEAVKGQLLRIRRSRVRLYEIGTMLVKPIRHIE